MAEVQMPVPEDFPNKSETAQRKQEDLPKEEKRITKVTTGKVSIRKKPIGRRFAEAFGAQEGQGVIDYILYDIIVPATKNMLLDSISDGVEMALFGEVRGRRRRSGSGSSPRYAYDRVSYRDDRDRYRGDRRDRRDDRRDQRDRDDRRERRNIQDYEYIFFDSKKDAEAIISSLIDIIDQYGQCTVIDLYDLAGITPEYTYGNYGWTNLSNATSVRDRDGYTLRLPTPILL